MHSPHREPGHFPQADNHSSLFLHPFCFTLLLASFSLIGTLIDSQNAFADDGNTLLYVHAHPDDEGIFGGGVLPYYAQVAEKNVISMGIVTRDPNGFDPLSFRGTSRVEELENAVKAYAGVSTTSTNSNGHLVAGNITFVEGGYIDTGCCDPNPFDSFSDSFDEFGWGSSVGVTEVTPGFGNVHGISDGRFAAAYGIAREIRRYRPGVVVIPHDLEGDYGHSNHTATAIATIDAFSLAADANVDIDGLSSYQAQKLYLRGDANDNRSSLSWGSFSSDGGINSLFHERFENPTIDGMTPREVANLGVDQHVSQGGDTRFDVSTVFVDNGPGSGAERLDELFNGHHSEWWTLYRSTVGADSLEDPFTVSGDTTGTLYTNFARGDFFQNITTSTEDADFNQDTVIDGEDFLIWQRGFGVGTMLSQGDADGSGTVDSVDLTIWQSQYDTVPSDAVTSVPEPGTILLVITAAAAALARRQ